MKIRCVISECVDKCSQVGGILPLISKAAEMAELKKVLKSENETSHVIMLELRSSKVYHAQSFIKFKTLTEGTDITFPTASTVGTSNPGKPNSLDWLVGVQKNVYLLDLESGSYGVAPDTTKELTQICAVPTTASLGLMQDQASWRKVDDRLAATMEVILAKLKTLKDTLESHGFIAHEDDGDESRRDQVLPDVLLRVSLVNSLFEESRGQMRDGFFALDFLSKAEGLIRDLVNAITLAEDGLLVFGDMTCKLSSNAKTECITDDHSESWIRLNFFSKPSAGKLLAFNHIIYKETDEEECLTEVDGIYVRLPISCCLSIKNHDGPEDHCLTMKVEKALTLATLQLPSRQLILSQSNSEKGPCFDKQMSLGSRLFTDCKAVILDRDGESATLVSNSDGRFFEVLESFHPQALKQDWGVWMSIFVTVGASALFSVSLCVCALLCCQNRWVRRIRVCLKRIFCCCCELCSLDEEKDSEQEEREEPFMLGRSNASAPMNSTLLDDSRSLTTTVPRPISYPRVRGRGSDRSFMNRP